MTRRPAGQDWQQAELAKEGMVEVAATEGREAAASVAVDPLMARREEKAGKAAVAVVRGDARLACERR